MSADEIAYYIQQLHTSDSEDASHALLTDTSAEDLPVLMRAYDAERSSKVKAALVEIIWHKRAPDVLDFLAQSLQRSEPDVWKAALDGITAIGGEGALALLEAEISRLYRTLAADTSVRVGWIDKAINQITRNSVG
jgi:hypothetical protein